MPNNEIIIAGKSIPKNHPNNLMYVHASTEQAPSNCAVM